LNATLPGDIDLNGQVNFTDFLLLSENFGTKSENGNAQGDIDNDGIVAFEDFLILAENFGRER